MIYKLPIIIPQGLKPVVTQGYGATGNLGFYKENGVNIPFHNGVDICTNGTSMQTYGCPVITPSGSWTVFKVYDGGNPLSNNGNEVVIHSSPFQENGITKWIELRFVHLSKVYPKLEGSVVPENTVIGNIGNSGLVLPVPTPAAPYNGTHLHLGMIEYYIIDGQTVTRNEANGVYGLIDPLTRININQYDTAPIDVTKEAPPLTWGIQQLGLTNVLDKIKYVWNLIFG